MMLMRSLGALAALVGLHGRAVDAAAEPVASVPEPDPVPPMPAGLTKAQRRARMQRRLDRETARVIAAGPAIGTRLPDGSTWTRQRDRQRARLKAKGRA